MTFVVTRQRAQEVHDRARARAGLPYAYGGAFTNDPRRSTDCSGLVLQTAAWYGGRTDWVGNRYGSTESFRLDYKIVYDLGFKRLPAAGVGALPFQPVMLVGLQHGGGGRNSHTACTLMTMDKPGGPVQMSARGVDWESRGGNPGVFLYDGARAWNDRLFHDFWYLDARLDGSSMPQPAGNAADVLARATGLTPQRSAEILPTMVDGLDQAQCTNPNRIAMFIAQTGHESANFARTEEYASGAAYEGRGDLGNTRPGDGVRFKGRTWIQITGRHNYGEFSRWAHGKGLVPTLAHFVDRPVELQELRWAGIGAAWYWTVARPDINALSDRRDLDTVTRRINGGTNGLADRRNRYNRALALGDELLVLTRPAAPADELEELLAMKIQSRSPYATKGEPPVDAAVMIATSDMVSHRILTEEDARDGDIDAIRRLARTAAGQGPDPTPARIRRAARILNEIDEANPEFILAATPGRS